MAFKIGSTTVFGNSADVYDTGSRATLKVNNIRPNANGDLSVLTISGPGIVTQLGPPSTYLYRAVITKGFMLGGYKDSSPWKNVNRVVMATDVTTNLGDQLNRGASYVSSGWDETSNIVGVFGTVDAFMGSSVNTSLFNMTTEVGIADVTGLNMHVARDPSAALNHFNSRYTYVSGGGSNSTSKIMWATSTNTSTTAPGGDGTHCSGIWGETAGQVNYDTAYAFNMTYSTETYASWGMASSFHGVNKGLSTKLGWGYMSRGNANVMGEFDKYLNATGAWLIGPLTKPQACGEENYITGQYHGYCLGLYNNAQVNNSFKWHFLTDTGRNLGTTGEPKGHNGASSGGTGSSV